jgi:hypothetical protein
MYNSEPHAVQAEKLVLDLSSVVSAELDSGIANYELLFGINTVARAEFIHMQQELVTWAPLMNVRHPAHPLSICRAKPPR